MSAVPLLAVDHLHVHYGAGHVLRGVSLQVQAGESVSLLGRNGMGKTTAIRAVLGLIPASAGTVRVLGTDMTGAPAHRIARAGLALVPEGRGIFPNLTVRENLVMAARHPPRPHPAGSCSTATTTPGSAEAPHAVSTPGTTWTLDTVLELFPPLSERLGAMGDRLSGGEQQMLAIGRALMTNPRLLILDEATEGLAPLVRRRIWEVIRTITTQGVATVIVDKDLHALLALVQRAIILVKGEVVFAGTARELAARPELHLQHLGI